MPQVRVPIKGRQLRMAWENGEEARLRGLAQDLDARIGTLRSRFGEIGDTRLTVMAALALADELSEVKEKLQRLEPEPATLEDARGGSAGRAQAAQAAVGGAPHAAAQRIPGEPPTAHQATTARARPRGRRRPRGLIARFAGSIASAQALHWARGAARCVRSHTPGALSILKGAVPDRARGLGHMAPTYFRREPGIDAPTAIAAPRSRLW